MRNKNKNIRNIIEILKKEIKKFREPVVSVVARRYKTPFHILISCMLSLRTKDEVTSNASERLFKLADTPLKLSDLSCKTIEKTIYPVGFYRVKARNIKNVARVISEKYNSKVPDTIDELLKLNGVGRKTANLVVTVGYKKLGICVDTHVHRISNRFGFVDTKTPDETEFELRKKLPKKYWLIYNDLLVTYGQNICKPVSPFCSMCKIAKYCERHGVTISR